MGSLGRKIKMSFLVGRKNHKRVGLVGERPWLGAWSFGSGLGPVTYSLGLMQLTVCFLCYER